MAPKKATVDNSATIRSASRKKQRSEPYDRLAAGSFGSSSGGGSLASSLSSLFSPQPHGKDAALASLLASSSTPQVKLGQASGLAAFGSFTSSKPASSSVPSTTSLDDKQKEKRKDASVKPGPSKLPPASATAKAAKPTVPNSTGSTVEGSGSGPKDRVQKSTKFAAPSAAPTVPNVPAGRRPVFRPVLASSTAVSWPEMPIAGSKTVLHTLIEILGQPDVQSTLHRDLGRRTRIRSSARCQTQDGEDMDVDGEAEPPTNELTPRQVLAGINSITRAIEADIAGDLSKLHDLARVDVKQKGKEANGDAAIPSVKIVFVCRHDVPSPSLIAHLPMLITARNAVLHAAADSERPSSIDGVLLFALPSGSEILLAKALNLRRASVIALTSTFTSPHLDHIKAAIDRETGTVCQLRASWLETAVRCAVQSSSRSQASAPLSLTQRPTSIKLLRTTQPMDLNKCKAEKKTKRKERSARWKQKKYRLQQKVKRLSAEVKTAQRKERMNKRQKGNQAAQAAQAAQALTT